MKKTVLSNNYGQGPTERPNYHHPPASTQDRKCDNCGYKVTLNESSTFRCKDCGTYIVSLFLKCCNCLIFEFDRSVTTATMSFVRKLKMTTTHIVFRLKQNL